eukprot:g865.t1
MAAAVGPSVVGVGGDALLAQAAGLLQQGRAGEAEEKLRGALRDAEAEHGERHPVVAHWLNNLAQFLQDAERLDEAEEMMRRVLRIEEQSHGPRDALTGIAINNLAMLLKAQGRLDEAEPLMRRALAIDERVFGRSHPSTAVSLNNLAQLLKAQGALSDALGFMRRALEIDEVALGVASTSNCSNGAHGTDHPDLEVPLSNMAILYEDLGRWSDALSLRRRLLMMADERMAELMMATEADDAVNIEVVGASADDGDVVTAIAGPEGAHLMRLLTPPQDASGRKVSGSAAEAAAECMADLSTARRDLAAVLGNMGEWAEAESHLRRALVLEDALCRGAPPPPPLHAETEDASAEDEGECVFPEDDGEVCDVLNALADAMRQQGPKRLADAAPLLRAVLARDEAAASGDGGGPEAHPEGSDRVWASCNNLAMLLKQLAAEQARSGTRADARGHLAEAEALLRRAIAGSERARLKGALFSPAPAKAGAGRNAAGAASGEAAAASGDDADANAAAEVVAEAACEAAAEADQLRRSLVVLFDNLVLVLRQRRELELGDGAVGEAEATRTLQALQDALERNLRLAESIHGSDHPNVVVAINKLVDCYKARAELMGKGGAVAAAKLLAEAELLLRRALRIDEECEELGPDHPHTATSKSNLALLLQDTMHMDEAYALLQDALRVQRGALGAYDVLTVTTMWNLHVLLVEVADAAEGKEAEAGEDEDEGKGGEEGEEGKEAGVATGAGVKKSGPPRLPRRASAALREARGLLQQALVTAKVAAGAGLMPAAGSASNVRLAEHDTAASGSWDAGFIEDMRDAYADVEARLRASEQSARPAPAQVRDKSKDSAEDST